MPREPLTSHHMASLIDNQCRSFDSVCGCVRPSHAPTRPHHPNPLCMRPPPISQHRVQSCLERVYSSLKKTKKNGKPHPSPDSSPSFCSRARPADHRQEGACMWFLKSSHRCEGSSKQLLEHLLRHHLIQCLGQNRLVSRVRRDRRTCGRQRRSGGDGGGAFGRRASSNLGFLGLPLAGPTVFHE